jgi:hypothetical protein
MYMQKVLYFVIFAVPLHISYQQTPQCKQYINQQMQLLVDVLDV